MLCLCLSNLIGCSRNNCCHVDNCVYIMVFKHNSKIFFLSLFYFRQQITRALNHISSAWTCIWYVVFNILLSLVTCMLNQSIFLVGFKFKAPLPTGNNMSKKRFTHTQKDKSQKPI